MAASQDIDNLTYGLYSKVEANGYWGSGEVPTCLPGHLRITTAGETKGEQKNESKLKTTWKWKRTTTYAYENCMDGNFLAFAGIPAF